MGERCGRRVVRGEGMMVMREEEGEDEEDGLV